MQTGNKDGLLSLDFGLKQFGKMEDAERFRRYRRFLYEAGAIDKGKGAQINQEIVHAEREKDFNLARTQRFLYRTRYFTDSGIIGTKDFVRCAYRAGSRAGLMHQGRRYQSPSAGLWGFFIEKADRAGIGSNPRLTLVGKSQVSEILLTEKFNLNMIFTDEQV